MDFSVSFFISVLMNIKITVIKETEFGFLKIKKSLYQKLGGGYVRFLL